MPAPSEDRPPVTSPPVQVVLSPSNVWRVGFAVAAMVVLVYFLNFVLTDAGPFLLVVVMAWFLSLAMEPPVARLARHMRRGAATALVMAAMSHRGIALPRHVRAALPAAGGAARGVAARRAERRHASGSTAQLGTKYEISDILQSINLTPQDAAGYAQDVLGGLLGLVGTVAGVVFNAFALVLLTFYLSADGPRARRWIAGLLSGRFQQVFLSIWDLSTVKTGGYVAARLVLAAINGGTSALVFLLLGMPSWLALGVWTGVVAQFVPTIGTYIAIALPVVVGLASPTPWIGVAALIWAVIYQQVENLTLEPRISARSVNIHPGVSFAAAIMGALLFGAVGALLAIPVVAMLLSVLDTFGTRHAIQPSLTPVEGNPEEQPEEQPEEPERKPSEEPAEPERKSSEEPAETPGKSLRGFPPERCDDRVRRHAHLHTGDPARQGRRRLPRPGQADRQEVQALCRRHRLRQGPVRRLRGLHLRHPRSTSPWPTPSVASGRTAADVSDEPLAPMPGACRRHRRQVRRGHPSACVSKPDRRLPTSVTTARRRRRPELR